ncbi:MAG: NUDIX domain-containing protein [Defluviitaleaceae bacterium]|nr:NUDIX domain-containing protein [Defluviitaleaceae bacterium]
MTEVWDLYDRTRAKTGATMLRGEKHPPGGFHLAAEIAVFNGRGEMLIQQRAFSETSSWSELWGISAGGAALQGEDCRQAAARELREEIGIDIDFSNMNPVFTIYGEVCFIDYFLVKKDVCIDALQLQKSEVQQVKWATRDEIIKMLRGGEFVPYYESVINWLFDMNENGKYGALWK